MNRSRGNRCTKEIRQPALFARCKRSRLRSWRSGYSSISTPLPRSATTPNTRSQSALRLNHHGASLMVCEDFVIRGALELSAPYPARACLQSQKPRQRRCKHMLVDTCWIKWCSKGRLMTSLDPQPGFLTISRELQRTSNRKLERRAKLLARAQEIVE